METEIAKKPNEQHLQQQLMQNLKNVDGDEINRDNDWTPHEIDGRLYLNTGLALFEVLVDEQFAALRHVSPDDSTLMLFPYRNVETQCVVEPGNEFLGGSMPYVTEIIAKIIANRPWTKPQQSESKTRKQLLATKRAMFDVGAGAKEKQVLATLAKELLKIDQEDAEIHEDGNDQDDGMTWADIRKQIDSEPKRSVNSDDDDGSNGDESSESSEISESSESGFGGGDAKNRLPQSTFDGATSNRGSGFDGKQRQDTKGNDGEVARSAFLSAPNDNFDEQDDIVASTPTIPRQQPALSQLPRYNGGQFSGYGKLNNAPRGVPVTNINCSGREYDEAYGSDEEISEEEYDSDREHDRQITESNFRRLMADADALEQYDPQLVAKPRLQRTRQRKQTAKDTLAWHSDGGANDVTAEEDAEEISVQHDFEEECFEEEGYDEFGGYSDGYGGYYDTEGGFYDADGGYWSEDGSYIDARGMYYSPREVTAWENGAEYVGDENEYDYTDEHDGEHFFNGQWLPVLAPENVVVNQHGEVEERLDTNLVGLSAKQARKMQKTRQQNADEILKSKKTINKAGNRANTVGKEKRTLGDELQAFGLPQDMMQKLSEQGTLAAPSAENYPKDISQIAHLTKKFVPRSKVGGETDADDASQKQGSFVAEHQSNSADKRQSHSNSGGSSGGGISQFLQLHSCIATHMQATASQMRATAKQMEASANLTKMVNEMFAGGH